MHIHISRYQTDACVIVDYIEGYTRKLVFSNGHTGTRTGGRLILTAFLFIHFNYYIILIYVMLIGKIKNYQKVYHQNMLENSNYSNTIPIQQKKSGQVLLRGSL